MELEELKLKIYELQLRFEGVNEDKSLFLQDAVIFKSLVEIVDEIKTVVADVREDGKLDYLEDILLLRDIKKSYKELSITLWKIYYVALYELDRSKDKAWIEQKCAETYINNNHANGKTEFNTKYLEDTNTVSISAKTNTYFAIKKIWQIVENELYQGQDLLDKICTDDEFIRNKAESGLVEYSKYSYSRRHNKLKREVENLKNENESHLPLSPEIWGRAIDNEEEALTLAIKGELNSRVSEKRFKGFSEDYKLMEENGALMQKILDVGTDDDLFDFDYAAEEHNQLFALLTPENIYLFYFLILRHNIIRCETFPYLKEKYREWLNADDVETLSEADKVLLERLLNYVEKADWQNPANSENIKAFVTKLFDHREFRDFFKEGRGSRVEVSMANILGYLKRYNLLAGTPTSISNDVFGNDKQVNNINKGMNHEGNQNFKDLLPLMDKYRQELIVRNVKN